jgi:hypothetical protein
MRGFPCRYLIVNKTPLAANMAACHNNLKPYSSLASREYDFTHGLLRK